jgi:nucleotide-binding universal stress UspA family protein
MGCYCTILVALDGSPDARAGLQHAATLACDQRARLIVMTVVPPPRHAVAVGAPTIVTDHESAYARDMRAAIGSLPPTVSVESRLVTGRAAKRILEVADDCRCDLIVMGFHGHGRLHTALMGSVSATVLRESDRPVLLVRASQDAPQVAAG